MYLYISIFYFIFLILYLLSWWIVVIQPYFVYFILTWINCIWFLLSYHLTLSFTSFFVEICYRLISFVFYCRMFLLIMKFTAQKFLILAKSFHWSSKIFLNRTWSRGPCLNFCNFSWNNFYCFFLFCFFIFFLTN